MQDGEIVVHFSYNFLRHHSDLTNPLQYEYNFSDSERGRNEREEAHVSMYTLFISPSPKTMYNSAGKRCSPIVCENVHLIQCLLQHSSMLMSLRLAVVVVLVPPTHLNARAIPPSILLHTREGGSMAPLIGLEDLRI